VLIEVLISIFLGTLTGVITGLIPGIHINLVGAALISLSILLFEKINPLYPSVFIVSLSISHTFIDFIPSIFLGCPDTENQLSILPGHEMLKEGRAYEAVKLTSQGALYAILFLLILSFPFSFLLESVYFLISKYMFFILLCVFLILILKEKNKLASLFIFVISGILGICTLNLNINEPLLPLFTGLFGCSTLIISLKNRIKIPDQKITYPNIKKSRILFAGIITSPICGFLPGLGSGQSSILANIIARTEKEGFLFLNGFLNILIMGLSFVSLYSISKTRTGSAVAIKEILGIFSIRILLLFLIVILISGILSYVLSDLISKKFVYYITKIDYSFLSKLIIIFLFIITIIVSGFGGLIILIVSTILGIYCNELNVKRTNMMGCLLIPTMIYYFLRII
jgi:putative membrane protein